MGLINVLAMKNKQMDTGWHSAGYFLISQYGLMKLKGPDMKIKWYNLLLGKTGKEKLGQKQLVSRRFVIQSTNNIFMC